MTNNFLHSSILITWIYGRTSGDVNPPQSIPNQINLAVEYANDEDLTIMGVLIDEAKTGTNTNREGYQKLMALIEQKQVDILLVTFFDRLSRQAEVLIQFLLTMKEKGIECISICEGKKLSQMTNYEIAIVAINAENENIARTNRFMKTKENNRAKGQFLHKPPFGYRRNEKRFLQMELGEAKIVRQIFCDFLSGIEPKEIAKYLNNINAYNRKWSAQYIEYLLSDKKYTGKMYKRINGENDEVTYELLSTVSHDIIIDEETFNKANELLLQKKKQKVKRPYVKQKHIFKNVIFCPECSMDMRASNLYYVCANKKCNFNGVRKDKIEKDLLAFVRDLDNKSDSIIKFKQKMDYYTNQLKKLSDERMKLMENYAGDDLSKEHYREKMFLLIQKSKEIQKKIDFSVYLEDPVPLNTLIDQELFEELNTQMKKRGIKLSFYKEGENFKVKTL